MGIEYYKAQDEAAKIIKNYLNIFANSDDKTKIIDLKKFLRTTSKAYKVSQKYVLEEINDFLSGHENLYLDQEAGVIKWLQNTE